MAFNTVIQMWTKDRNMISGHATCASGITCACVPYQHIFVSMTDPPALFCSPILQKKRNCHYHWLCVITDSDKWTKVMKERRVHIFMHDQFECTFSYHIVNYLWQSIKLLHSSTTKWQSICGNDNSIFTVHGWLKHSIQIPCLTYSVEIANPFLCPWWVSLLKWNCNLGVMGVAKVISLPKNRLDKEIILATRFSGVCACKAH